MQWKRKYPIPFGNIDPHIQTFIHKIPKVEIHVHFEGSLPASVIFALAQKHNTNLRSLRQADAILRFRNPHQFFQNFLAVSSLLRSPDDFYKAAVAVGERYRQESIRYAELTLAPHKFIRAGIEYPAMMDAIEAGLHEGSGGNTQFRYIIDVVRDLGLELGMDMMRIVEQYPRSSVVGIGLGGSEAYPPESSREIYAFAESLGLRKTAHAGEGKGPESIWGALKYLDVERIDHGVRAWEDPTLVRMLAERQIPLNMCISSNVLLGVVPKIKDHPIRQFYKKGLAVNCSTDDPPFFATALKDEFCRLIAFLNFSVWDIPVLIQNGIQASFLADGDKQKYKNQFKTETDCLAQQIGIK